MFKLWEFSMNPITQSYTQETPNYFIIQHHEFYYNLNEITKRIDLTDKFLFIVNYMLLSDFNGKHRLNQFWEMPLELIREKYEYANATGKKFFYVIECLPEAQNYFYELIFIDNHIKKVMKLCNLESHQIINLSGAHDKLPSPYQHCIGLTQFGVGIELVKTFGTHIPKHHFVSLSNWPRKHRVISTIDIWNRQLEQFGFVSLNLKPGGPNWDLVPKYYHDRLPCYISGPAEGVDAFKLRNTETEFAFVNLVHETSIEYGVCDFSWHSIFLTEKSIKPFAWGQVSIFNTIRHHVKTIREFGFDLFDDLIDHSYDEEIDPYQRIKMGIDQLEKICRMSLIDIQDYKRKNMHRFLFNRVLAEKHLVSPDNINMQITADNLTRCLNYQP